MYSVKIKILVAAHKPYWMPGGDCYLPIHVGCAGKQSIGFQGDDTGDNISAKKPALLQLTALYWAWKNLQADYIGGSSTTAARCYFTRREVRRVEARKQEILTTADWEQLLQIILSSCRTSGAITSRATAHTTTMPITPRASISLSRSSPSSSRRICVMDRSWAHMFNMFVMRRDFFDAYCSWLFAVLGELEQRIDIIGWNTYESRVFGFVSERLLDVWLEHNHIDYHEQNVSFLEHQDWLKKGSTFLLRKISGNRY